MLNQSRVLQYVKDNLAFEFMTVELSDEKILEHITTYTLREFSSYFPYIKRMNLNLLLSTNQTSRPNEYYLNEEEGLEILNVVDVYFNSSQWYALGHPPVGAFSLQDLREFALSVETAGMIKQFSNWDYTHEFIHPNILRLSPTPTDVSNVVVEIEVMQPVDLSKIPNQMQNEFNKLALADIMIILGRIRRRFEGNLRTPFGEIPIGGEIYDQGMEMKRELVELLKTGSIPNVVLDIG
jgi:hypothetical protein